jgi:hypothetical protein
MYIISAFMGSCFAGASATSHAFLSFSVSVSSGENCAAAGGGDGDDADDGDDAVVNAAPAFALPAEAFFVVSDKWACWSFLDGR